MKIVVHWGNDRSIEAEGGNREEFFIHLNEAIKIFRS